MRMNFRKVEDSDYHETIKKKTIINCEEMQYFQEDELSEADEEEEGSDGEGGGTQEERKKQPNSGSTQLQTQYLKTKSNSEESKGETVQTTSIMAPTTQ